MIRFICSEGRATFKHPCTCVIAGLTGPGIFFTKQLFTSKGIIDPPPHNIIWCFGEYQYAYDHLGSMVLEIRFVEAWGFLILYFNIWTKSLDQTIILYSSCRGRLSSDDITSQTTSPFSPVVSVHHAGAQLLSGCEVGVPLVLVHKGQPSSPL